MVIPVTDSTQDETVPLPQTCPEATLADLLGHTYENGTTYSYRNQLSAKIRIYPWPLTWDLKPLNHA